MVILSWYKYKTIKCFLRNQGNLICFLIKYILPRVFLELLIRVFVKSVFFLIRIVGEMFLNQRVTFIKKFY